MQYERPAPGPRHPTPAKLMVRVSEKLPAVVLTTVPVERRRPMRPVQSVSLVRQLVLA